jgi:hypothetical protein
MAEIHYNIFTQWEGTELSEPETSVHERAICKNNNNLSEVGIPMLGIN